MNEINSYIKNIVVPSIHEVEHINVKDDINGNPENDFNRTFVSINSFCDLHKHIDNLKDMVTGLDCS